MKVYTADLLQSLKILYSTLWLLALVRPAIAGQITVQNDTLVVDFDFSATSAPQYVIDHWQQYGNCQPEWSELGPDQIEQLRLLSWVDNVYRPYTSLQEAKFRKYGEATFFGHNFLDASNFHCDFDAGGCHDYVPDCSKIVEFVKYGNPDMPIGQVLEEGLRRYIVTMIFGYVGHTAKKIDRDLELTHTTLQGRYIEISQSFFPGMNSDAELACSMSKLGLSLAMDVVSMSVSVGVGGIFAMEIEKGMEDVIMGIPNYLKSLSPGLKNFYTNWATGTTRIVSDIISADVNELGISTETMEYIKTSLDNPGLTIQSSPGGLCGSFGSGRKDEVTAHAGRFQRYWADYFKYARTKLVQLAIDVYQNRNIEICPLRSFIEGSPTYNASSSTTHETVTDIVQRFTEESISFALKASRCFVEAEYVGGNSARRAEFCSPTMTRAKYRWCPPDDDTVYQMSCSTSQERDNHQTQLFGFNDLIRYGINPSNILPSIVSNYHDRGDAGNAREFNLTGLIEVPGEFSALAGKKSASGASFTLPVCEVRYKIKDFEDYPTAGFEVHKPLLPCSCGTWDHPTTGRFMREFHTGPGSQEFASLDPAATDIIEHRCPGILDMLSRQGSLTPIEHFIDMCALGIQMPPAKRNSSEPLHQWHQIKVGRGPHPACRIIEKEVSDMTLEEANVHFCNERSEAVKSVFGGEGHFTYCDNCGTPFPEDHWRQCRRYPHFIKDDRKHPTKGQMQYKHTDKDPSHDSHTNPHVPGLALLTNSNGTLLMTANGLLIDGRLWQNRTRLEDITFVVEGSLLSNNPILNFENSTWVSGIAYANNTLIPDDMQQVSLAELADEHVMEVKFPNTTFGNRPSGTSSVALSSQTTESVTESVVADINTIMVYNGEPETSPACTATPVTSCRAYCSRSAVSGTPTTVCSTTVCKIVSACSTLASLAESTSGFLTQTSPSTTTFNSSSGYSTSSVVESALPASTTSEISTTVGSSSIEDVPGTNDEQSSSATTSSSTPTIETSTSSAEQTSSTSIETDPEPTLSTNSMETGDTDEFSTKNFQTKDGSQSFDDFGNPDDSDNHDDSPSPPEAISLPEGYNFINCTDLEDSVSTHGRDTLLANGTLITNSTILANGTLVTNGTKIVDDLLLADNVVLAECSNGISDD